MARRADVHNPERRGGCRYPSVDAGIRLAVEVRYLLRLGLQRPTVSRPRPSGELRSGCQNQDPDVE